METPYQQILKTFKENNRNRKELFKYVFEKSDSISLWVIGLAIGAVTIIANDIAKVKENIPPVYLPYILIALLISVIAGIVYRTACLHWFVVNDDVSVLLDINFSEKKEMHTESYLDGNESFIEIVSLIQRGFGYDYSNFLSVYDEGDEPVKQHLYKVITNVYLNNVEWAKTDKELALDYVMKSYAYYAGTSVEKYKEKILKQDLGKKYRRTIRIIRVLYAIYFLSFIAALILFAIATCI